MDSNTPKFKSTPWRHEKLVSETEVKEIIDDAIESEASDMETNRKALLRDFALRVLGDMLSEAQKSMVRPRRRTTRHRRPVTRERFRS